MRGPLPMTTLEISLCAFSVIETAVSALFYFRFKRRMEIEREHYHSLAVEYQAALADLEHIIPRNAG